MREYNIIVEPFALLSVVSFTAIQQVNNHGKIELTGLIESEKKQEYIKKASNEIWIKISVVDEQGKEIPFFNGILERFKIEVEGGSCLMSLSASTGTKLMDLQYHTRSFQDEEITYRDVIDIINKVYPQSGTIMTKGKGIRLSHFYMQYRESDWVFIKRLASYLHTVVIPSCSTEGVKYFFGVPEKREDALFKSDSYWEELGWEDYKYKKSKELSVSAAECTCFVVCSREIHELGSNIIFKGRNLCIWKIETILKNNELIHKYYLKNKNGLKVSNFYNERLIGLTLLGKVIRIKGEAIQMNLDVDENKQKTGSRWFQYSTIYSSQDGTGWYCMPEEGDAVRLYFPTEDEANVYAISAVHEKNGAGIRIDPEQKIWRNKAGKEIRLAPERILLTNNNGMSVELNDYNGIKIKSNKSICLTASEDISISSDNAGVELNASNLIVLNQGDARMVLENGIQLEGAKVKLE